MARIDKTDSAVGVIRGTLKDALASTTYGDIIGVGFDSAGLVVPGAGQTGIVGVIIPDRTCAAAGSRIDVFVLAEILEAKLADGTTALAAGTKYYVTDAAGVLTATSTNATAIGYTVEADRLVVRM